VNRKLAKAVVSCLRPSEKYPDVSELQRFKARDWQRRIGWLDRSGLALYLLRRLHSIGAGDVLPPGVLARFEQRIWQTTVFA
jgi:hypothetical protein